MTDIALPTLTTVLITALIDSINPCAIGVLILLLSTLLVKKNKKEMFKTGMLYIIVVFLTYLTIGIGLTTFLGFLPLWITEFISIFVGMLVVIGGLLEIKDFFWYGAGFSLHIPKRYVKQIKQRIEQLSVGTVLFLGVFVAVVELPCTGGPYLAITLLLKDIIASGELISIFHAIFLLVIYNLIFVLPLIIILILTMLGMKLQDLQNWKQSNKSYMRLFTGLLMIGLGWLLMLIANGTINLN